MKIFVYNVTLFITFSLANSYMRRDLIGKNGVMIGINGDIKFDDLLFMASISYIVPVIVFAIFQAIISNFKILETKTKAKFMVYFLAITVVWFSGASIFFSQINQMYGLTW